MTDRIPTLNTSIAKTDNQIVNFSSLDREAELYKTSKQSLKDNAELIQKAVDQNTKEEIKQVQDAITALNKKVERIMETDFVKDKKQKVEDAQKQMMSSIKEASKTYFQVRDVIRGKEHLSTSEKREYEQKLFHKILDKFMTKEEKDLFIQIVNAGPMIMLGGRGGGGMLGGLGGLGGRGMIGF